MNNSATYIQLLIDLFSKSDDPVLICDNEGRIFYASEHLNDGNIIDTGNRHLSLNEFITAATGKNSDPEKITARIHNRDYLFSTNSNGQYFIITGTDITDLVKEKNFYHEVLDSLPADIGVFDTQGKYLYVNPIGIKDKELRDWIIGKTDFDYCNYRGRDTSMAQFRKDTYRQVVETKQEISFEEQVKKEGQEPGWQLRKISPVLDEKGEVKFIMGYGINISERKKAELAQKEALDIIERSAKAKEDFVAVMSHEIRTPMNAIIGMSRILEKTNLDEKQQQYLEAILAASGNLIVIVNDILDFSKIEAGKLRLDPIGFTFSEVINYAKAVTAQQAAEKDLYLKFHIDENISEVFIGDVYRINQVIVNLLNNAIKFTHRGKVMVSVLLEEDKVDSQQVCIAVEDTGIGMSDEFMQQIFSMYSQDQGITREYGGTGLGLKITSQLVELMHGSIDVASKKNEGSAIKVRLTLPKGTEADLPSKQLKELPENALAGKNILLAEDNALNVLVASTVLKNNGADVTAVANGKEAVDALKEENSFDAVLMDIEMPEMDGITATKIIRNELNLSIPVIALTANVMPEDKKKLNNAGVNGFIAKPFAETDLIIALLECF